MVQILHAACAAGVAATFSSLLGGVLLSLDARSARSRAPDVRWGDFDGEIFQDFPPVIHGCFGGIKWGWKMVKTCHKLHLQELMLPQIYTFQVYWGCFLAAVCGAVTTIVPLKLQEVRRMSRVAGDLLGHCFAARLDPGNFGDIWFEASKCEPGKMHVQLRPETPVLHVFFFGYLDGLIIP